MRFHRLLCFAPSSSSPPPRQKLKERIALRKDDIKRLTRTIDIAEDATGYSYEVRLSSTTYDG